MVIVDELESASLRENCGLVIDGAVFEAEDRPSGDLIPMDDFGTVSGSE